MWSRAKNSLEIANDQKDTVYQSFHRRSDCGSTTCSPQKKSVKKSPFHGMFSQPGSPRQSKNGEPCKTACGPAQGRKQDVCRTDDQRDGQAHQESVAEIEKCAWLCDYYADAAPKFLETEYVKTEALESYVTFEPLGIVLAIMPWNFPFWQAFRFGIPQSALECHCP